LHVASHNACKNVHTYTVREVWHVVPPSTAVDSQTCCARSDSQIPRRFRSESAARGGGGKRGPLGHDMTCAMTQARLGTGSGSGTGANWQPGTRKKALASLDFAHRTHRDLWLPIGVALVHGRRASRPSIRFPRRMTEWGAHSGTGRILLVLPVPLNSRIRDRGPGAR
jgi:hypothetical protein